MFPGFGRGLFGLYLWCVISGILVHFWWLVCLDDCKFAGFGGVLSLCGVWRNARSGVWRVGAG